MSGCGIEDPDVFMSGSHPNLAHAPPKAEVAAELWIPPENGGTTIPQSRHSQSDAFGKIVGSGIGTLEIDPARKRRDPQFRNPAIHQRERNWDLTFVEGFSTFSTRCSPINNFIKGTP